MGCPHRCSVRAGTGDNELGAREIQSDEPLELVRGPSRCLRYNDGTHVAVLQPLAYRLGRHSRAIQHRQAGFEAGHACWVVSVPERWQMPQGQMELR